MKSKRFTMFSKLKLYVKNVCLKDFVFSLNNFYKNDPLYSIKQVKKEIVIEIGKNDIKNIMQKVR